MLAAGKKKISATSTKRAKRDRGARGRQGQPYVVQGCGSALRAGFFNERQNIAQAMALPYPASIRNTGRGWNP